VRWYIAVLYKLVRCAGRLPLPALHRAGAVLGWLLRVTPNPVRRKARATLDIVVTQFQAETRHSLLAAALGEAGKAVFEVCKIWSGDPAAALALIREVRGGELFERALAAGSGVIVAAPHLGCWELLNFWLCSRTPIAIAYRPPRQPALEPLLVRARRRTRPDQPGRPR
jgi:KDO2-lipid IV(A) lauroyltransferase